MKKKLALLLGSLLLAFTLTACGDPKTEDYNGKTYDDLKTESLETLNSIIENYNTIVSESGVSAKEYFSDEVVEYLVEKKHEDKYYIDALIAYENTLDEYGTYCGYYEDSFEPTKSGKTTTADLILVFKNSDGVETEVTYQLVYESWNMKVSSVTMNPVQTLGQKMSNAGMNTLISMAIVFCVLILISLIIYAFNIFPYIEKKKKEKAERKAGQKVDTETVVETTAVATEEVLTDDYELVAVIAAAIAASEGCSTSDFVVRSINRR